MREPRSGKEAGLAAALNNWTIPQEYLGVIVRVVPVLALLVAVVLVWPGDDGNNTVAAVRTEATKPSPTTVGSATGATDVDLRTTSNGQSPRPVAAPDAELAVPSTAPNTTGAQTAVTITTAAPDDNAVPRPAATTSTTPGSTAGSKGSGLSTAAANTTTSTSASTRAADNAQQATTAARPGAATSGGRATSASTAARRTSTTADTTSRPTTATTRATTGTTGPTTTRATTSTTRATTTTTQATMTTPVPGGGACSSGGQFERVFRDDFNGSSLGGEWIKFDNQPGNSGFGRREASALSVENGRLVITARMVDGALESSGIALPRYQTYGKYVFRVRTDNDPSQAMSGVALTWPQSGSNHNDGENNIYETLANSADRNPFYSFIHKPGSPATEQKRFVHNADGAQFQTMTMEWTPEKISVRREGPGGAQSSETQTLAEDGANRIPDNPHRLGFQLDAWKNSISGTVKMEVDWVEIHKYCG